MCPCNRNTAWTRSNQSACSLLPDARLPAVLLFPLWYYVWCSFILLGNQFSTITRERLTQSKSRRVFCPLSGLDRSEMVQNEKKTNGSGLYILIAVECWRKSSVLPSHYLPPSMQFGFNTSVSEGLHTSSCHHGGLWVEANFNCWIMNTGLLESKEGTKKVNALINYRNHRGCRLIMED